MLIGCHLSCNKGYLAMGREMTCLGANTCAFFTRNPRGGKARALDPADIAAYERYAAAQGFGTLVAHGAYTVNLCAAREDIRAFGRDCVAEDLQRLALFSNCVYNIHPGSHVGQGTAAATALLADALRGLLAGSGPVLLLETMAGKGTELGGSFAQLRDLLDAVDRPERLGVCLDTCHVWDAGYDLRGDLEGVLAEFDRVIGLHRLRALHLNDSMNPCGSRKDRHACIGQGALGIETFRQIIRHPLLRTLPMVLETPVEDSDGYAREIALLRSLA